MSSRSNYLFVGYATESLSTAWGQHCSSQTRSRLKRGYDSMKDQVSENQMELGSAKIMKETPRFCKPEDWDPYLHQMEIEKPAEPVVDRWKSCQVSQFIK